MSLTIPRSIEPGISVLGALFQHNAWASLKLLDFCARLSEKQLSATSVGTYGSIRDTIVHLIEGEISYVERVNGKLPENPPPWDPFPAFEVLAQAVRWTGDELLKLALSAHSDTLVVENFPEGTEQYKLTDLMVQAVTHSTEHRTQVSTIITQLGLEPPDMSSWQWMDEKGDLLLTRRVSTE